MTAGSLAGGQQGRAGEVALAIVLAALLAGVAGSFELAGRTFVVSWIDVAAAGVAVAGGVRARRERVLRLELALGAYAAFLGVAVLQALLRPDTLEVLGGSSRFVTAALVLVGLGQLCPVRWTVPLLGFGSLLGAWVVLRLGLAVADPALASFYAVKNAVVTPLGASNTLAGYLLVPAVAGAVLATREPRWWLPTALAVAGVVGTLSRGALAALVGALAVAAIVRRGARAPLVLTALAAIAGSLVLFTVVGPGTAPPPPPPPAAQDPAILDPVDRDVVGVPIEQRITPSADGRLALWRASVGAFLERPVLGVGLNRITEVTRDLRQPHDHAHNALLHALVESGLAGTVAYLAIWAALARRLRRAAPSAARVAIACGALALGLHAQVEALTYQRGIEVLVAVLLVAASGLAGAGGVATRPAATLAAPIDSRPESRPATPSTPDG